MEIGYHRIGHRKVIRREDELIRPAFIFLQMAVCADGTLYRTHHRSTYGTHLPVQILGTVYNLYGFFRNNHLLGIRLMLGKVLYIDVAEVAQTGMQCNIGKVNSLNLHALHQLAAEMQACRRSRYSTFVAGKDRLETFRILRFHGTVDDAVRQRRLTQSVQCLLELVVRPVIQKTKGTSARSGIVNHLGYHRVIFTEIEFVADTDFAGRVYQHVPQAQLLIQLTQQKYLDTCTGFFLVAVQPGGKHLRIIKDKYILIIEIIQNILEHTVFDFARLSVQYHQARLISIPCRM